MEVNKEQAEKCRDLGAAALRQGQFDRATRMLRKSLQMYPLPGVEALLHHAQRQQEGPKEEEEEQEETPSSSASNHHAANGTARSNGRTAAAASRHEPPSSSSTTTTAAASDGRTYTEEQVRIVQKVLRSKEEGGRGEAHYRVLQITSTASEGEIKKAYRKLSLKVHPDKNAAPGADEAFKAVGLAYATLSDQRKRAIYDRYGDEDPDNRGGAGAGPFGGFGHVRRGGQHHVQEVDPDEIFNMFFGGAPPGGNGGGGGGRPGVRVYTAAGFGPGGVRWAHAGGVRRRGGARRRGGEEDEEDYDASPQLAALLLQFFPVMLIMLISMYGFGGQQEYFSLTRKEAFAHPLWTTLTEVRDIPYFVTDRFMRTIYRDQNQLYKVERMVQFSYEKYLVQECRRERSDKEQLLKEAKNPALSDEDALEKSRQANDFRAVRCTELLDLFPKYKNKNAQQQQQQQRQQQQQQQQQQYYGRGRY